MEYATATSKLHFGDWLRDQIANQGVTQVTFANRAGVPLPTLKGWIGTPCPPMRAYNIVRVSKALGMTRQDVENKLRESRDGRALAA